MAHRNVLDMMGAPAISEPASTALIPCLAAGRNEFGYSEKKATSP